MAEVTCIGGIFADLTAGPVIHYPEKGRLVKVDRMQLSVGGCAANTAADLSKLGIETSLIAKVGNDDLGDVLIKSLKEKGVDTKGICRDEFMSTGGSMVLNSHDGERSFIASMGANASLSPEDIDWEEVKKSKLINYGGALLHPALDGRPISEVFQRAKRLGLTTCMDTQWDDSGRWWNGIADCMPYTDIFLPSLVEAERLTGKKEPGEIAKYFMNAGVKIVGIKMGKRGSCVYTKDKEISIPVLDVKTVDTNGAGDAYVAGFIAGWIKGLPLEKIAYLANGVGAMATMAVGAVGGIKKLEEVSDFIKL